MWLKNLPKFENVINENKGYFESVGLINQQKPDMLTFLEGREYLPELLNNSSVSCVITTTELAKELPKNLGIAITNEPKEDFFRSHNFLASNTDFYWDNFATQISSNANVHPQSFVADKNVKISNGAIIEPGVVVQEKAFIGENVVLRSGSKVGTQGFEFKNIESDLVGIEHAGGVKLREGVEVQANSVVDSSVFGGMTEIGEEVKIDNLVQIAHNVTVGNRSLIAASAMIAGSVSIGQRVWVGPNVSIPNGLTIGDKAKISIGSVVTKDVQENERVTGNFAIWSSQNS